MSEVDYIVLVLSIVVAFMAGIRSANDSWIHHGRMRRTMECRGKLYTVEEQA